MKKFEITYHLTGNITLERIVEEESFNEAKTSIDYNSLIGFTNEHGIYHQFHGRNIILATIAELRNVTK